MAELHPSPTARHGYLPSEDVITKGINADIGPFSATKDVYCKQCGFPCNLARDLRNVDEFAGESITSGNYLGSTTTDSQTVLLLHGDGTDGSTTFTDSSASARTVTVNGNVQIDTAQSVFGTGSILFDGTGDYLSVADSNDWNFGTDNFMVELRARFNSLASNQCFISQTSEDTLNQISFTYVSSGDYLDVSITSSGVEVLRFKTGALSFSINTWYSILFSRNGNTWYIIINGESKTLTKYQGFYSATCPNVVGLLNIGATNSGTANFMNGWLDEIRIVKGRASIPIFTPPLNAYLINNGNGSFENWTGGSPDYWGLSGTVTQVTTAGFFDPSDDGTSSARIIRSGLSISLNQEIITPSTFNNQHITFRARVKSSTNNVIRLRMDMNGTSYYSSYNIAHQRFQEISISVQAPVTVSSLTVYILADNANGTAYVDQSILARDGNPTTASVTAGCPHCGSFNYA